jgi:hypothetical protein
LWLFFAFLAFGFWKPKTNIIFFWLPKSKSQKATPKGPSASDLGFRRLGFHSFPPTSNNFNSAPKFPPKSPRFQNSKRCEISTVPILSPRTAQFRPITGGAEPRISLSRFHLA